MLFVLLALAACVLTTLYIFVKQYHQYFETRGIPCPKPTFFLGNCISVVLGKETFPENLHKVYKEFPECKYIGYYKFLNNSVLIRDPELLNEMLVKDFNHFSDNEMMVDENVDFIMSKSLFFLKGHQWKTMRGLLSPMFSSGKLKYIFPLSEEVSQRMTRYLHQEITENRNTCINGKALCHKFTIDNVASCAFGLDAKAFEGDTKFTIIVKNFNNMSYLNSLKFLLLFMFPKLNHMLKIKFFQDEVEDYLTDIVSQTLKYRKENNIVRNDFLDQINALKEKSVDYPFTDRDIVAQGAGFFMDGVETSAGVSSWVLLAIARHPEVQKKVRAEINQVKAANNGQMTYEGLNSMTYLEAVIHETLRMDNPVGALFKVCTKTYTLPEVSETNKAKLVLNPGDPVLVSVDGFNFNPNYFPDPHTFKPERFFNENKEHLVKNTFLPFGTGPRFCMGMRFAFLQIKLIVTAVVGSFQVDVNEKMLPIKTHPNAFMKTPLNGFWFDITELPEENK